MPSIIPKEEDRKEVMMQMKGRSQTRFVIFFVALSCLWWAGGSQAQDYPKGTVQLVIPYSPGGLTDIFWRSISEELAKKIKGNLALVNKPGGAGVVGTSFVVNSRPDGYTLVNASPEAVTIAPAFTETMPYDSEKDLTYIGKACVVGMALAVRNESPFKTLEDLVAFAKANPGKLKTAGMGIAGTPNMIMGVFKREANVDIAYIPFDGGGEVVTNIMGGHTDFGIAGLPAVKGQALSGQIRILAVCAPKRLPSFPDIPTLAEKGYKKSSFSTTLGLAGPKGLDPAIVSKWEDALDKTLKDPKVIALVEKIEGVVIDFKRGEDYKKELFENASVFKEIAAGTPKKK
jgi:tripartite-type tricarboxylate transporter receptor subunit TctC